MRSPNQTYIPAIDHLRGLAVLLIIYYHGLHIFSYSERFQRPFSFENWLQTDNFFLSALIEGHTAVAFFMVLSGFIFTYGSLDKTVDYKGFVVNRLLRTYPLFILLLFTGIYAFPDSFQWDRFLLTLFALGNIQGGMDLHSFSSMFWAIAVEWQFYLLFPLLLKILQKEGVGAILGLIAVFLLMRALALFEGANIRDLSYWTIIGRMDQFLLGMLIGAMHVRGVLSEKALKMLFPVVFLMVCLILHLFHKAGGWPDISAFKLIWPTIEGAGWAIFILSYIQFAQLIPSRLSQVLVAIGVISYSLYLIHFTVITICLKEGWLPFAEGSPVANALANTTLVVLPVVFVVSAFTYRFIEKPFLNMRIKYHRD
ncbi:MAG: hypothetical protein C0631_09430 [Sedimenticola sp.]|nr:MAG: hypothetical protein C0631_09430 [Sedimenticola sp.]